MQFKIILLSVSLLCGGKAIAQDQQTIIGNISKEAHEHAQLKQLGWELIDDIGPRLIGSPQMNQAHDWVVQTYKNWGIAARNEIYGQWKGWERGETDVIMTYPRFDQLDAMQLAWSPATAKGKYIEGEVIMLPTFTDSMAFQSWLPQAKGKIVMISKPEISGRPASNWKEFALEADFKSYEAQKQKNQDAWNDNLKNMGTTTSLLPSVLEKAGALALLSSYWSGGWSSNRIFAARTQKIPHADVRMEDYQMLYRFTQRNITPKVRLRTTSKDNGMVPAMNTVAEISSSVNPEQYVFLSAHLDSWDGGTGATDNGTGTILMMEVMRILKKHYPNPKRSIIAGHWGGEEQGINGSRGYAADHPDMMSRISVLFNQDNGTGRINWISGNGYLDAYEYFNRWLSYIPEDSRKEIKTDFPGAPGRGGSDYASFLPFEVPAFFLIGNSWDYGTYTWHTTLDTYDKIVWEDLQRNAETIAILIYLACEDPEMFSRRKATLPLDLKTGERAKWPEAAAPNREGVY